MTELYKEFELNLLVLLIFENYAHFLCNFYLVALNIFFFSKNYFSDYPEIFLIKRKIIYKIIIDN